MDATFREALKIQGRIPLSSTCFAMSPTALA
jgi:hypothetical protein